jgi:uncharacterized protein (DUF1800 family)
MNPENGLSLWKPYRPTAEAPWNLERVVHLHRRAAFAAPWPVLERDLAGTPEEAVDRLLEGGKDESFESLSRTIGDAALASDNPARLKAWWMYRMIVSPDPLGERLTLMWHNHFATSNLKVQDLALMREQNELFRRHARGPFSQLLKAVVKHPAMLTWLDADANRAGHPNENLARELMELFTLGIDNYTETDVKQSARALTGWTVAKGRFEFSEARHDNGEKTILGRTEAFDGDHLLEHLLSHPATAARLAWRICQTFFGENVAGQAELSQLAEGLRSHQLDVGWALKIVLHSELFFSEKNLRSQVIGPAQWIVGSLRALEQCNPPASTLGLADWSQRMGQDLFYPPNVGGWNGGRSWLASRNIIARSNYAHALAEGKLWHSPQPPSFEALVEKHNQGGRLEEQIAWFAKLLLGRASQVFVDEILTAAKDSPSKAQLSTAIACLLAHPQSHLG